MKSICEYLEEDYEKWGNDPYLSTYDGKEFCTRSFKEAISDILDFSKGLLLEGLSHKNLMIYSENSYEWMIIDLSIMGYVGTCIPVDKEWTAYDVSHTLSAIEVAALFYSRAKKDSVDELREKFPNIKYYCIEDEFERIKMIGRSDKAGKVELKGNMDMDETSMILFTSGTTSVPKAIPLTQSNLFDIYDTLNIRTPMLHSDISYVFLPLNHVFAGVDNLLYSIISGMQIYLCHDIKNMVHEMLLIKPTIFCVVPLILNRLYQALNVAENKVFNEQVLNMLRHIHFLYCGGSFLDPVIKNYFLDNGIHLLEAYGSTETSSVIALDKLGDENTKSSGVVFENLQVKILDPDQNGVGEILVKGGSVSKGYLNYSNNASVFDSDGYYHTGDLAYMDEERHLYLKGRKKRMVVTGNGKNVYVDEIEKLLLVNEEIKKVVVYEENYHITATIISNLPEKEVHEYVESINQKLPGYKQIRKFYLKEDVLGGRFK